MSNPLVGETTDATFAQDVLSSSMPVLVDFWAEWCGPCRMIAPLIDELATEYKGRLKVFKMNIDHNPETPAAQGVRGIPTLIVVKNGAVADRLVGALPKPELQKVIDRHVS